MSFELFIAGCVLVPLGFGLVPAFLPRKVPIFVRWCLWLVLLAVSATFVSTMRGAPQSYGAMALGIFWASMLLSLVTLVVETRRDGRPGSRAVPAR